VNKDFGYDLSAASRKELIDGALSPQFVNFVADYDFKWVAEAADFPPSFGAAGGYDSVLLLAYATATLGSGAETGEGLAEGLKKLSNPLGPVINTGPKNIPAGFAALRDMGGIDFAGALGPSISTRQPARPSPISTSGACLNRPAARPARACTQGYFTTP
jgi:hypothetical protein